MKIKKSFLLLIVFVLSISLFACNKNVSSSNSQSSINRGPEWISNSVIYEVNIRQYTKEGTFNAFKEHLPRLKEMGVDVLWFMPIYPISFEKRLGSLGSYYAIQNYTEINPEFGTMADFKSLVDECHKMGFKVLLDWVGNHTGWDNEWIKNKDWYTQNSNGEILYPQGTNWQDVADLNYNNEEMKTEMINSMKFWVEKSDIDGFRCDYAIGVPTDFWEDARVELEKIKPLYMLAEDDKVTSLLDSAFDSNYGWQLYNNFNKIANGSSSVESIKYYYDKINNNYPEGTFPMIFTSNHDENSWNGTEYERLKDAVKPIAALTFTLPGIPLIYSGQEASLDRRLQFFDKDEISWTNLSMSDFYKDLIKLKKENTALWNGSYGGDFNFIKTDNEKLLVFSRQKGDNTVLVMINLSKDAINSKINLDGLNGKYVDYYSNKKLKLSKEYDLSLAPWEYKIFIRNK